MHAKPQNPRTPDWDIDSMFTDRWSPRAFSSDPLSDREVQTLFEAARWAPSCYNEQPWLFIYATEPEERASAWRPAWSRKTSSGPATRRS